MISNKYNIIEKISQGSFGIVYKGENKRTGELVAIKVESSELKTLKGEAKLYQYLGNQNGFLHLKWFGSENGHNYFVTNLLGHSLGSTIRIITEKNALIYGIQIIQRIQTLHENYMLHRDIKPDNFLFGLNRESNKLYLVDLGFAKRYNYDGMHIPEKRIPSIIGSLNFVSLNIHKCIEPSRRDDIESAIYILLYMYNGCLGWLGCDEHTIIHKKVRLLKEPNVPPFIKQMLENVRNLSFDAKPDYSLFIDILTNEIHMNHK